MRLFSKPKRSILPGVALALLSWAITSAPIRANFLYFDDGYSNGVFKADSNGNTNRIGNLGEPEGLTVDANGNVFVTNSYNNSIYKFTPGSGSTYTRSTFVSQGIAGSLGLIFGPNGDLFAANPSSNSIEEVSPDGTTITTFASGFNNPQGLAFDAKGDLFVANYGNNTIGELDPTGKILLNTISGGFNHPKGLVFDAKGDLFVANSSSGTIDKVTFDSLGGYSVKPFASGLSIPQGLAFDSTSGNLVVGEYNRIDEIAPDGTVTLFTRGPSGTSGYTGLAFQSFQPTIVSTPEPSSLTLLGLGVVCLAGCHRRRRPRFGIG